MLLDRTVPKPLPLPRTVELVEIELRRLAHAGEFDLPVPGHGRTPERWAGLAALGRRDLALARLAEGHLDALAILDEAGRVAVPDALYGVWAARSGGTGAQLVHAAGGMRLTGTVRFCSGANVLDRALVAAQAGDVGRLVEVDLTDPGIRRDQDTWAAIGMDATDSIDVRFVDLVVRPDMMVGGPDWYLRRRGFALGGAGVAAVWLGGVAGVLDSVIELLLDAPTVDDHQYAHLGALHTAVRTTEAQLTAAARSIDLPEPTTDHAVLVKTCKSAAERAAWETLDRAPRITGPTPLCRDRRFAQRLADLQVYVRQHHAERDLAALGRMVLAAESAR
jgi:alkylation response protein AidB-like acyl-CoA dehydrogenase